VLASERPDGDDDLLRPSVARGGSRPVGPPYAVDSQGYVAFFGGAVGGALVGVINARRLDLGRARTAAIAAIGVAGLALSVGLGLALGDTTAEGIRIGRIVGVVLFLVGFRPLQNPAYRRYHFFDHAGRGDASLLGPGFGAVVTGLVVEAVALSLAQGGLG